jgi:hypothetical protein
MRQGGEEARTAVLGTANPACGSRGMSVDFAVLHAFGARGAESNSDLAHDAIVDMRVTTMQECIAEPYNRILHTF